MRLSYFDATIADTETTSDAINVAGRCVVGVSIGTVAAATASFTATHEMPASPKGVVPTPTFRTLRDSDGVALSFTTTDDSFVVFDPAAIAGVTQLKIVAGSAASGDETWRVVMRDVD